MHIGALGADDVAQQFLGEVFALVMTYDAYLYLLLMPEVLVVMHLAGQECISTMSNGFVEQEVACSSTDRHATDWTPEHLVAHGTFCV